LQALRARRHPVTAATLARELEVSERTIYRDLADLAAQGAPIQGEAGIGYVLRPGLFLPPLMLTEDETEAVLLGLRYVDQRGDDVLTGAAAGARAKIAAILSRDMRETAEAPLSMPGPAIPAFPQNIVPLTVLRGAIKDRRRLAIAYADQQGRRSERVVWPVMLGFMDRARVVTGWCELRQSFRFFRTDRIESAEVLDRYPAARARLIRDLRTQLDREAPDRN
jgi:predicted DNA-binding transcriptional regulator YafY